MCPIVDSLSPDCSDPSLRRHCARALISVKFPQHLAEPQIVALEQLLGKTAPVAASPAGKGGKGAAAAASAGKKGKERERERERERTRERESS